jgi:hypothetical protein
MKTRDLIPAGNDQDRFARNVAARLNDAAGNLPSDISERLKSARMQALGKRKIVRIKVASGVTANGHSAVLHLGDSGNSLWTRLGSLLPLLVLIFGLLAIAIGQEQNRANEIAEVDIELLADDLPPAAYIDSGFVHYLKTNRRE